MDAIIPILYEVDELDFLNNGLGSLPHVVDSYAYEEANGAYEMYLEYSIADMIDGFENRIWRELKVYERQILYKPSHSRAPHAFRIYEYEIDAVAEVIKVWAKSRAYDLAGNMVTSLAITAITPHSAMINMKAKLVEPTDFDFYSDIQTNVPWTWWEERSGLSCIMGQEDSLIDRIGGEVLRANRRVSIYNRVGRDNVTTLRIGKNIEQLRYMVNTNNLVTAIMPVYRKPIEGSETGEYENIRGTVVKSPNYPKYQLPYYMYVEYTEEDGVTDLATLNAAAANWFNEHPENINPDLTIEVDMTDVAESTEYGDILKKLEQVNVFDTVTVFVEKLYIEMEIKVVGLKYDGVNERNLEVTLGSPTRSLFETAMTPQIKDLRSKVEAVRAMTIVAMTSADGKTTNYYGSLEPNNAQLSGQHGDLYFQDIGTDTRMWRFVDTQWEIVTYKADWLTGTIDGHTLNVVNINVAHIVGEIATFMRTNWNAAAGGGVSIDGNGVVTTAENLSQTYIQNGITGTRNPSGATIGSIGYMDFGGSPVYTITSTLGSHFRIQQRVDANTMNNSLDLRAGGVEGFLNVGKFHFKGNQLYIGEYGHYISGGGNPRLLISGTESIGLRANEQTIFAVSNNGTTNYATMYANLDMGGNTITNQSDNRLKKNIVTSEVSVLSDYESMRFVNYEWIDENKPEGIKFGLIAQETPLLSTYDSEHDVYSINSSAQIMYNSKAIQELYSENKALKKELDDLKTLLTQKGVI